MKERLKEFLRAENKSSAQLADEIGVQPSGISHILSGRNKPSLDFVLKMLEKYPFISTEWFLFGKGDMYKDESVQRLFEDSMENNEIRKDSVNQPVDKSEKEADDSDKRSSEKKVVDDKQKIEKIVWFYSDNSFREYKPEKE